MDKRNAGSIDNLLRIAAMEAFKMKHDYIGTEHLLLAHLNNDGIDKLAMIEVGVDYEKIRSLMISNIGMGDATIPPRGLTPRVKQILENSREVAKKLGHNYVGSEHVLLSLLGDTEAFSTALLTMCGISNSVIYDKIIEEIGGANSTGEMNSKAEEKGVLASCSRNLNALAKDGKIDPVVGREEEIERIIQVLLRRTKNNPVLIGEPGVGKTAIAEGLAQRIVEGNVPEIIKDYTILSLDMGSMVAGTKYRGEFEEKMKGVMEELRTMKNVILFIDEFHTIVGAGKAEGATDAATLLKPAMARGELQIIGATTIDDYRKNIEKDAALERRLQPIKVEEPNVEDTVTILKGLRDRYEAHHKVSISDEAILAASELSHRYLTDRFLPDKAIDLIDEAASMLRVKGFVPPVDLRALEEEIEQVNQKKEQAITLQNFEQAALFRDELKTLKEELEVEKNKWSTSRSNSQMSVGFDEIAKIVSDWSGVPVTKMSEEETEKYLNLDILLKEKVVGQDDAVDAISRAIKRARVGIKDPQKPVGSFIFVGPTGVGKTYLAKSLAEVLFNDADAMVRIDMSEYMEKHSVSKLIGSPPGYVGYGEGGHLTEAVRQKPYSVVLFDEVEKAHPDVFNMLLQILDDGRLTDSKGKVINFKNTVIVMTSNVGASMLDAKATLGFAAQSNEDKNEYDRIVSIVNEELKRTFRPEFLNRLDDIIVFNSLNNEMIRGISKLLLDKMTLRLQEVGVEVTFTQDLVDYIANNGYDKQYGARPIERYIRTNIEDLLTEEILKGNLEKSDRISIEVKDEKVGFTKESLELV
ncbi:MAG: ATP-dependent Clp protease ATP-binding subunit [Tissierellia bacterium]|nr:ATP-dependent Clp protease ATP-binding subunit [Tissierellia bacterium]